MTGNLITYGGEMAVHAIDPRHLQALAKPFYRDQLLSHRFGTAAIHFLIEGFTPTTATVVLIAGRRDGVVGQGKHIFQITCVEQLAESLLPAVVIDNRRAVFKNNGVVFILQLKVGIGLYDGSDLPRR